jgi:hypothetical protein
MKKSPTKKLGIAVLLAVCLALIGCGSSNSNPSNINGNWNAALTDTGNTTVFTFGTSLVANNSNGTLTVSNFSFSTNSSCFVSGETESGSFVLSGNFNGNVTGKFQFNVTSGSPSGNALTLSGTANGNTIGGTWTLTGGTGCTGSGNFIMTKM